MNLLHAKSTHRKHVQWSSREFLSSIYQFRTICSEVCETLHLVDKNLKLDPPVENMEKQTN